MANETELSNYVSQTDIVDANLVPAFVETDNIFGMIRTAPVPPNTNVVKFAKAGSLTAAAGSESTAYSFGAGSELTDTGVSATATRKEVASKITVEALRFGDPFNELSRVLSEQGLALNRLAASELKTLYSSLSGTVTATAVLTKDDLFDAAYTVEASTLNASSRMLVAHIDRKGLNELRKELTDTGASVFVSQVELGGILGTASAGEPVGMIGNIAIYPTSGLPTSGSDDVGAVYDPALCFAGAIDPDGVSVEIKRPESQEPWVEVFSYAFWNLIELNDSAGVGLLSDT